MRIVVVEDDPDIAELHALTLGHHYGHHVTVVDDDFGSLLNRDRWDEVDAAIVDLWLDEGTSGLDILRWLADNLPTVRRVAYSAAVAALEIPPALAHAVVLKGGAGAADLQAAVLGDGGHRDR